MPCFLHAQEAPTDSIPAVELPAVTVRQGSSATVIRHATIDNESEVVRSTNVVDALQKSGFLFLKTYGLGSLATASVRGGAAGQTAVNWNGIALQSPMLGLLDLSLLPSIHLDEVRVDGGGQSAVLGSGAVAGNIGLRSYRPDTIWQVLQRFHTGSFRQFHQAYRVSGGTNKLRVKLSAQFDRANNDFPFRVRDDLPEQRLAHAEFEQRAWQQSLFWQANSRHEFTVHAWQQATFRNLPPTAVENVSLATQADDFRRQQLIWRASGDKVVWTNQLAFARENIHYRDPLSGIDAPSTFDQLIAQSKRIQDFGKWELESGGQFFNATAFAREYRQDRRQRQFGLYQQARYYADKGYQGELTLRSQWVDARSPLPALQARLIKEFSQGRLTGTVSRDFRVPTLNDLYWRPGGNSDLKTELSWSQEIKTQFWDRRSRYYLEMTLYNRRVDDWIQWAQQEGSSFWSAGNVTEVWSRGVEFNGRTDLRFGTSQLHLDGRYQYTRSTYEKALINPMIEAGDQLWYTPVHLASLQIGWERKHFLLQYMHRYVGATEGINADLSDYQLGDLSFIWRKLNNQTGFRFFVELNNLWNETYRVIERRPMPSRNVRFGIQTNFSIKD